MPLLPVDLAEVLKHQVLDDDQITFLVYQILRALKVFFLCDRSFFKTLLAFPRPH